MRIVVTEKGEDELVKALQTDYFFSNSRNDNSGRIDMKTLNTTSKKGVNLNLNKKKISFAPKQSLHEIAIKQKRLNLPKNFADKYLKNNMKVGTYLPSLPNQIIDKTKSFLNLDTTSDQPSKETYTLRDIITDETLQSINSSIRQNELQKEKQTVIDETKFRSTYQIKSKLDLVQEKLDKEITSEKIYMIKYLNSKSNLSEFFIEKLNKLNEEELQKVNRISQKVIRNEDTEKIYHHVLKEKLKLKKQKEIVEAQKTMTELDQNLDFLHREGKKIYRHKPDVKLIFHNRHMDLRRIWAKYNCERIAKPKRENYTNVVVETSLLINNNSINANKY